MNTQQEEWEKEFDEQFEFLYSGIKYVCQKEGSKKIKDYEIQGIDTKKEVKQFISVLLQSSYEEAEEENQKLPSELIHEIILSGSTTPSLTNVVGEILDHLAKKNNWKI